MSGDEAEGDAKPDDDLRKAFEHLVSLAGGPTKAARSLQVSRTTLDQWAKGRARIPLEPTLRLARLTKTSLDEVFANEGHAPSKAPRLRTRLQQQRDAILAELEAQDAEGEAVPGRSDTLPDDFVAVPMLSVQASAGGGHLPPPEEIGLRGVAAFRADWLRARGLNPDRTHVLTAVGDSMEPTIRNGDFLLVDRSIERVIDNGIYVVVLAGLVLVKRVQVRLNGALVLKSENPVYGEEVVPPDSVNDMVVEGRVCWFGRGI